MTAHDTPNIPAHEDVELFREAVAFTAAQMGFIPRLVEKDYFCTLLLQHVTPVNNVVFKGGTPFICRSSSSRVTPASVVICATAPCARPTSASTICSVPT